MRAPLRRRSCRAGELTSSPSITRASRKIFYGLALSEARRVCPRASCARLTGVHLRSARDSDEVHEGKLVSEVRRAERRRLRQPLVVRRWEVRDRDTWPVEAGDLSERPRT